MLYTYTHNAWRRIAKQSTNSGESATIPKRENGDAGQRGPRKVVDVPWAENGVSGVPSVTDFAFRCRQGSRPIQDEEPGLPLV